MAQAAPARPWERKGSDKREFVREMFDDISPSYDRMNSLISLRRHHRWRSDAVAKLGLGPGGRACDLCCGTGDFGLPLRRAVGSDGAVIGMDFSERMLRLVRGKRVPMNVSVGDACRLPIVDEAFDAVTVGWGLRNVIDLDEALSETYRILKPGGVFVTVDMAVPRSAVVRWGSRLFSHFIVPLIGRMAGKAEAYRYLPKSTERFETREELSSAMTKAGFRDVKFENRMFGNICIHWGDK